MIIVLQVAEYKGFRWVVGLFSMPLFHIYRLFGSSCPAFFKTMGLGKNGTFDIQPDWHRWAIMGTWDSIEAFKLWEKENYVIKFLEKFSPKKKTIFLEAHTVHGLWDGVNPFEINNDLPKNTQVAVLTRATIKFSKLKAFWANVPKVAQIMPETPGLIFSLGIGEIPFIKQATISFWETEEQMLTFAYKQNPHKEVIKRTRTEGWYSEELFARFNILKIEE